MLFSGNRVGILPVCFEHVLCFGSHQGMPCPREGCKHPKGAQCLVGMGQSKHEANADQHKLI